MRTEEQAKPSAKRLSDYRPPDWLVDAVALEVDLNAKAARVRSTLTLRRNPEAGRDRADLRLDGRGLKLVSCALDGAPIAQAALSVDEEGLTVAASAIGADEVEWFAETEIDPSANTAFEGLYYANGMFCTQCEAEGFRKIAFFPDRPDVMATYTVRITAPAELPVLLSNGDLIESGEIDAGRRFAVWRDPHPKPSYLFALVAGDLRAETRAFRTKSGRDVDLALWVRPGDEAKTGYALDALERAMRWDEREYGREYDLDRFNVVATSDFNMGAMENKGLNIFNSKYVLASAATATDRDYALIESVVAHEYFHNWTGNRITCRDWFQLCLKEGLTVFRDQQFSAEERSAAVKRIEDVQGLRAQQFREDEGPLAHPVRPEEYVEINNFYTATVYEKGAEVVRMLRTLLGADVYRKALDLYFERHDGQACAIEDFRRCFEEVSGRDLTDFALWWSQAGTPRVTVEESWDETAGRLDLVFRQSTPPTPGQSEKKPLVIPMALGLLGSDGRELLEEGTRIVELREAETRVSFEDLPERPVPSLLRGFSAPVRLETATDDARRAFLLAHDADPFNRWDAGRAYALDVALRMLDGGKPDPALVDALGRMATDAELDPAFRALALELPGEDEVAREVHARGAPADPDAIHQTLRRLKRAIAAGQSDAFSALYAAMGASKPYSPDAKSAGRRALRNRALAYLAAMRTERAFERAREQLDAADNMSEQAPALTALVHNDAPDAADALARFYDQWKSEPLVVDKWFAIQATAPVEGALDRIRALTEHPAFDWMNPNRFRSLIGAFAMGNPSRFHAADGSGYAFFADWLIRLDAKNPQTTARLAGAFETWRRHDEGRANAARAQLERIAGVVGLSKDLRDIVERLRASG